MVAVLRAIIRAALATIAGMSVFFATIVVWVFVIPAVVVFCLIVGGLLIGSCFALVFWIFTSDPNALRAFCMMSLAGAAPFGAFALVRHVFAEVRRAMAPKDAPFADIGVDQTLEAPVLRLVGSPWMRSNAR